MILLSAGFFFLDFIHLSKVPTSQDWATSHWETKLPIMQGLRDVRTQKCICKTTARSALISRIYKPVFRIRRRFGPSWSRMTQENRCSHCPAIVHHRWFVVFQECTNTGIQNQAQPRYRYRYETKLVAESAQQWRWGWQVNSWVPQPPTLSFN